MGIIILFIQTPMIYFMLPKFQNHSREIVPNRGPSIANWIPQNSVAVSFTTLSQWHQWCKKHIT